MLSFIEIYPLKTFVTHSDLCNVTFSISLIILAPQYNYRITLY